MKRYLNAENVTALVIVIVGVILAGYIMRLIRKKTAAAATAAAS